MARDFLSLYLNRQAFIWKGLQDKHWRKSSSQLWDHQILGVIDDGGRGLYRGCYFGELTKFAVLDIDKGSPYHNAQELEKLTEILVGISLAATVFRSSKSGGWHLYIPLTDVDFETDSRVFFAGGNERNTADSDSSIILPVINLVGQGETDNSDRLTLSAKDLLTTSLTVEDLKGPSSEPFGLRKVIENLDWNIESTRNFGSEHYIRTASEILNNTMEDINELPADRRRSWQSHQIAIAETLNPEDKALAKSQRDIEFPDIALKLTATRVLLETGRQETDLELIGQVIDDARVDNARKFLRAHSPLTRGFQTRGRGQPTPTVEPLDNLFSPDIAEYPSEIESLIVSMRADSAPEFARTLSIFQANRSPITGEMFQLRLPASRNSDVKSTKQEKDLASTTERLEKFDNPTLNEALDLRQEKIEDSLLTQRNELPENWARSLTRIKGNRHMSLDSKVEAFRQIDRMVSNAPDAVTEDSTRSLLATQLVLQAGQIETIDQGNFKTCNITTIEKVLDVHHLDHVARMIADISLTGKTTTAGGREVELDKSWLLPAETESLEEHKDGDRSLVSQYVALIGANIRFQQFNERFGTDLHYGLVNGEERVLDYSTGSPREVYDLDVWEGTFSPTPVDLGEFSDGRPLVDENLTRYQTDAEQSPGFIASTILDVYEELSGRKGEAQLLSHYDNASRISGKGVSGYFARIMSRELPEDSRISMYRDGGELRALLKEAQFPVFFTQSGHITTVNGYSLTHDRCDYDNQWGAEHDFIGEKGLSPNELAEIGGRENPKHSERIQKLVDWRKEYESWCAANAVAPDSRYPTKEELAVWRNTADK